MSFTVYRSSAGSGKTYTLVKEYLKLTLPDPPGFRNILAITFTNKAANEMKERVMKTLQALSEPEDQWSSSLRDQLVPELLAVIKGDGELLRQRASEARALILHHYSEFAVGTIDSFSHRLVRTFAREFGLAVNFNVELDAQEMLTSAIDLLLERVGGDAPLTGLLVSFLQTYIDDDKSWRIEDILLQFSKKLLDEESQAYLDRLKDKGPADFQRIAGLVHGKIREFESEVRSLALQAVELINSRGLAAGDFYYGAQGGIYSYFHKLLRDVPANLEPGSRVLTTLEEDKWTSGKTSPQARDAIAAIREELIGSYLGIRKLEEEKGQDYYLMKVLSATIYPLGLLNEIGRMLDLYQKQNNLIHISEFNRRISAIIVREPVPFIYERLGEKYRHMMIDEFQDTSVLQWKNMLPLLENALGYGYFNLLVGDGKQAIYRWRNGDVAQFAALPAIPGSGEDPLLKEREALLSAHFREANLQTNFRSGEAIVGFNNDFFTWLRSLLSPDSAGIYAGCVQETGPGKAGEGYVSLGFLPEVRTRDAYRQAAYPRILGELRELERLGYRKREVAVLCRKNKDASDIARFLIGNGIGVVSSESLLLSQSPDVNLLICLLRFLTDPDDRINNGKIIAFLVQQNKIEGTLDEVLGKIAHTGGHGQAVTGLLLENGYRVDSGELSVLSLFDLCETLVRLFGLQRPASVYLQFFLDHVLAFSAKNQATPAAFLEWWEKKGPTLSVVIPRGLDAVNVMTIHKAKGLQFPAVIFPAFPEAQGNLRKTIWIDLPGGHPAGLPAAMADLSKTLEKTAFSEAYTREKEKLFLDDVNVLYVALTRPESWLSVIAPAGAGPAESVPVLLRSWLEATGQWTAGKDRYEFGKATQRVSSEKTSESCLEPEAFISTAWNERISLRRRAAEKWGSGDALKEKTYGNLLHTLLAELRHADDLPAVLARAEAAGLLSGEDRAAVGKKLQAVLEHPVAGAFFRSGLNVKTETELMDAEGAVFRPDRVILEENRATVIDYKTGKPDPAHERQLHQYGALLKGLRYSTVVKYLLYLEPEIRPVEVT